MNVIQYNYKDREYEMVDVNSGLSEEMKKVLEGNTKRRMEKKVTQRWKNKKTFTLDFLHRSCKRFSQILSRKDRTAILV